MGIFYFTGNKQIVPSIRPRVSTTTTGGGGGTTNVETPVGSVNGSNTAYSVSNTPTYIVADGITYYENNGYTISGLNITMVSAPTSYIRSHY